MAQDTPKTGGKAGKTMQGNQVKLLFPSSSLLQGF
jgi:hypothetical protein